MQDKINHRTALEHYVQLQIITNPHLKIEAQKDLFDKLNEQIKKHEPESAKKPQEFDAAGFELLKQKLSQNSRFQVIP